MHSALECQCLKDDFERLTQTKPTDLAEDETLPSFSPQIWDAVIDQLKEHDMELTRAALRGTMALPGLELFRTREGKTLSRIKSLLQ